MPTELYTRDLLRLATQVAAYPPLVDADGRATRRATTCGSRIEVSVAVDADRRIDRVGLQVQACAVGQGSAALLAQHAAGLSRRELATVAEQLRRQVSGQSTDLPAWLEDSPLLAVAAYPARHGAALLPYDSLLAALDEAEAASRNVATSES